MRVFFTASYRGKKTLQKYYDKIIHTLESDGIEVLSLEVQVYADLLEHKFIEKLKSKHKSLEQANRDIHYYYIKKAIDLADAVIMETTMDNFRLGYEARTAIDFDKPTLCLSQEKDFSMYFRDIKLYAKQYQNEEDLESIVKSFINEVKNKLLNVRMHVLMPSSDINFLDWLGKKEGKNRSEIIRALIHQKRSVTKDYYKDKTRYEEK